MRPPVPSTVMGGQDGARCKEDSHYLEAIMCAIRILSSLVVIVYGQCV